MEIALVYMVAGLSSRFGGRLKQLVRVGPQGETLIEYSIKQALPAGFTKIIFIVGEKTEQQFKELFKDNYRGIPVHYAFQHYNPEERDRPWGTNDALCTIKNLINHPIVICNGDDIYGKETFQILTTHLKNNNHDATVGYKLINVLPEKGRVHRGLFQTNNEDFATDLKETFDIEKSTLHPRYHNQLCSMNIFALFPETINKLNNKLTEFKKNNKGHRTAESLLPNEISSLIKSNHKMKVYQTSSKWFGITNPEDEEIVRNALRFYREF